MITGEQHIAYEGEVELKSWTDSSSAGAKVRFILDGGRDELCHFETVTKRRGKRAGQRYWVTLVKDESMIQIEAWFCGANWAHQDGASITIAVTDDDLQQEIKQVPVGTALYMVLVEIGDDEMPVNQVHAVVDDIKGGPLSKHCARLCKGEDFQTFLLTEHPHLWRQCHNEQPGLGTKDAEKTADLSVKLMLGIESKKLLDHDPKAAQRYQAEIVHPFIQWGSDEYGFR